MILVDVNVLVYAHHAEARRHDEFRSWFEALVNAESSFGMAELVLSSFIRIVTNPRILRRPLALEPAIAAVDAVRSRANCTLISPGPRHWEIFTGLCRSADARGNLVSDAYLAALAIESGSEWITTDRDYSRFPGLRWRHPLPA